MDTSIGQIEDTNFSPIKDTMCRIFPSMSSFLSTSKITSELEDIIQNASAQITLVTPYIKTNELIRSRLMDTAKSGVKVRIVYGKSDLKSDEEAWLRKIPKAEIYFSKNLHAKCYMNEQSAIIGSMNLYEFSQQNNDEMGILVSARDDANLYNDVSKEVERIVRGSKKQSLGLKSLANTAKAVAAKASGAASFVADMVRTDDDGVCIRCGDDIDFDPDKPYCAKCFKSWSRYKNPDYKEEYCHSCGDDYATSLAKPVCRDCYKELNQ